MAGPVPQIRFCTSRDGTRIAYATSGAGPPLVFASHWIHHLEFDWENPVWRPWLSLLTPRRSLVRFDFRGCGLSDRQGIAFSFDKLYEDLEAVVAAARLERFDFLGMAIGAELGMRFAVNHPERVDRLVLYGCYTRQRLAGIVTSRVAQEVEAEIKVIQLGWQSNIPAYEQFFKSLHVPDATPEQARAYNALLRATTSPENAAGLLRAFRQVEIEAIVPQVRCPSLVLQPRNDSVVPFEEGRLVASLIPGARFVPLDTRNFILLEQDSEWPQLVAELNNFLRIHPGQADSLPLDDLTQREKEILELVARGLDNDAIGKELGIQEKTVRNQVSSILAKLGVNSRSRAIVLARDFGLGRGGAS